MNKEIILGTWYEYGKILPTEPPEKESESTKLQTALARRNGCEMWVELKKRNSKTSISIWIWLVDADSMIATWDLTT